MVCSMTRGPAKPMSAFGSAMLTSPRRAKLAATPPVVGCKRTLMKGSPAARSRSSAETVLAICMRLRIPSCMRAPPDACVRTTGSRSSVARSKSRAIFSPTTDPIDPPMNAKRKAP